MPDFIRRLKTSTISCSNKLAIEFAILTAGRKSEILKARWDEIDFSNRLWTIPKDRMKGNKEHIVPLSDRSIAILKESQKYYPCLLYTSDAADE